MANYTPPASFTASQPTVTSSGATSTPSADISPSSLDILPALASILTRLQSTTPSSALPAHRSPHLSQNQSQTITQTSTSSPSFQPVSNSSGAKDLNNPFSTTPLSTKDIPTATDGLKHRLQKTRAQVSQLPDMDRSVAEQEKEIRDLEDKIAEQRNILQRLKALGAGGLSGT